MVENSCYSTKGSSKYLDPSKVQAVFGLSAKSISNYLHISRLSLSPSLSGINYQGRRQQSRRSRAASGGHVAPKERADNLSLRRSISDMNLSTKRRKDRKGVLSMAAGESTEGSAEDPRLKATEGAEGTPAPPASEEEVTDVANLEQLSQCLIQAPTEHPYFLQLLGYNEKQVGPPSGQEETYLVQCWESPETPSLVTVAPSATQLSPQR